MPREPQEDLYLSTRLALFEWFVALERFYFIFKEASFDWLKFTFDIYRSDGDNSGTK